MTSSRTHLSATVVLAAYLLVLPSPSAQVAVAGTAPEAQCGSLKLKGIGAFFGCRAAETAKARKKGLEADFTKCAEALAKFWDKAEAKGESGPCATADDESSAASDASACADGVLAGVDGMAESPGCVVAKQKALGKYLACRAGVHAKATKKGTLLDFTTCDALLTSAIGKAEEKFAGDCPTSGDLESSRSAATECAEAVFGELTPSTTTTTTSTTSTSTTTTTPPTTTTSMPAEDLLFRDRFETGDFTRWDSEVRKRDVTENSISVTAAAAISGSFGMRVAKESTHSLNTYVGHALAGSESTIRIELDLRLDAENDDSFSTIGSFTLVDVNDGSDDVFRLRVSRSASGVFLNIVPSLDNLSTPAGIGVTVNATDSVVHHVVLEWQKATSAGANNGIARIIVDGSMSDEITNLDNDTLSVTDLDVGILNRSGTWETVVNIDDFEIRSTFSE